MKSYIRYDILPVLKFYIVYFILYTFRPKPKLAEGPPHLRAVRKRVGQSVSRLSNLLSKQEGEQENGKAT